MYYTLLFKHVYVKDAVEKAVTSLSSRLIGAVRITES